MPAYVGFIAIDWHHDAADLALQRVHRAANEQLTDQHHTYDTFASELRALVAAHPGIVADALVEDGTRCVFLFTARDGEVTVKPVFATDLPWDEVVETDDEYLPTDYESEDELRAIAGEAAEAGATGQYVAAVGEDRYHVTLARKHVTLARLEPAIDRALYERLARRQYVEPPPGPRDPDRTYELPLYLAEEALAFVQREAARTDRSLSNLTQLAWRHTRDQLAQAGGEAMRTAARQLGGGDKRKQTLYVPGAIFDEIEAQATRLDVSASLVVQAAIGLARAQLAALPTPSALVPGD